MKKQNLLSMLAVLLCAVLMFGMLAGCANETTPAPSTDSTPSQDSTPSEPATEPAETPSEEPTEPTEDPVDEPTDTTEEPVVEEPAFDASATPFVDELTTLTAWCTSGFLNAQMNINNGNDNLAIQEMEKRTNVHIDWTHAPDAGATEAFNLMLASEEYDDIIFQMSSSYTQGLDYYVEEEILIDLKPYLETYGPDYLNVVNADDSVRLTVTTDGGRIPLFRTINYNVQPSYFGYATNQAWLDAAGITELPTTMDEFETMLVALDAGNYASNAALYLNSNGFCNIFMSAYDTSSGWLNIDRQVVYGPTTENYYQFLETMSRWYANGLVDVDFMSRIHSYVDVNMFMGGEVAVYPLMKAMISMTDVTWDTIDPAWDVVCLPMPRAIEGTPTIASTGCVISRMSYQGMGVTTVCQNPELAVQWGNYLYTEEGSRLADYGIEGVSYEFVEGKPVLTELMWANPDYAMVQQLSVYCIPEAAIPRLYAWERYDTPDTPEKVARTDEVWFNNYDIANWIGIPDGVALTAEENEEYAASMSDISTYMEEYTLSVITGKLVLSESWDEYVANCEQMGLSDCAALYQAALDRYYNK